jgi:CubicO group peptidase (beta-lactamase class C family)
LFRDQRQSTTADARSVDSDLDKPIEDYLGGLTLRAHVGDARRATVRRVANHTGGLPIHEYSVYADEGRVLPPFKEVVVLP